MKQVVKNVLVINQYGEEMNLDNDTMEFGYRSSIIKDRPFVVAQITLQLSEKPKEEIEALMEDLAKRRKEKQPLEYPSAGSTFKRPEGHFAGALIDEAGLRGFRIGGAQVSEKHCGFVINAGDASASDVLEVIRAVQKSVYEHSGVKLEPEIRMLGFEEL
jgi:UDP-N-acetylmuramate dehydrogenase